MGVQLIMVLPEFIRAAIGLHLRPRQRERYVLPNPYSLSLGLFHSLFIQIFHTLSSHQKGVCLSKRSVPNEILQLRVKWPSRCRR